MQENKNIKVLVLMGGVSTEREVSLRSGEAVYNALLGAGYNAVKLDVTRDNIDKIKEINPDVAFIALHGKGGEDGSIQGFLEWLKIPYTGPGIASSSICMNKILTKKLMLQNGIRTPKFLEFTTDSNFCCEDAERKIAKELGLPVVLKASCQGSSIGVEIIKEKEKLRNAINSLVTYGDSILAEEFIDGTEVTVPVLGNENPETLPIIEILSENEFYDYESKYTSGMSHHLIPARISDKVKKLTEEAALMAYRAAECKGLSRIDFIIDKNDEPYFIEINTSPGMTDVSLFPESAKSAGIDFPQLVDKIVKFAIQPDNICGKD